MDDDYKFDLFISFSIENLNEVNDLHYALKTTGYKIWIDKTDLRADLRLTKETEQALDQSHVFLCCATTSYCFNEYSKREFIRAVVKRKPIVYVLFENFKNSEDRLKKLINIAFEFSGEPFLYHNDINGIIKAIENLKLL